MVKAIALDLEEKHRLAGESQLLVMELQLNQQLVAGLEQKDLNRQLQLKLLEKGKSLLETQLAAERERKKGPGWMLWGLRLLGALGVGFVMGRV